MRWSDLTDFDMSGMSRSQEKGRIRLQAAECDSHSALCTAGGRQNPRAFVQAATRSPLLSFGYRSRNSITCHQGQ